MIPTILVCRYCSVAPVITKSDKWTYLSCPECRRTDSDNDPLRTLFLWNEQNRLPEKADYMWSHDKTTLIFERWLDMVKNDLQNSYGIAVHPSEISGLESFYHDGKSSVTAAIKIAMDREYARSEILFIATEEVKEELPPAKSPKTKNFISDEDLAALSGCVEALEETVKNMKAMLLYGALTPCWYVTLSTSIIIAEQALSKVKK